MVAVEEGTEALVGVMEEALVVPVADLVVMEIDK
jgi:hypothetical protein